MNKRKNSEKISEAVPGTSRQQDANFDVFQDFDSKYLSETPEQETLPEELSDSSDSETDEYADDYRHIEDVRHLARVLKNLDPESFSNQDNQDIILSYDEHMNYFVVQMLKQFAHLFKMKIIHKNENATHLIVKFVNEDNFRRSAITADALINNIAIVSLKWVTECLTSKTLVRLGSFMPMDVSEVYSPLVSWNVGRGYFEPRFDWTKRVMLFFHKSVELDEAHSCLPNLARKLGFLVADNFENFRNDDLELRMVLVGRKAKLNNKMFPSRGEILDWARNYPALTVHVDWLVECIFRYKHVEITSWYMPVKLPRALAYLSVIDVYYRKNEKDEYRMS